MLMFYFFLYNFFVSQDDICLKINWLSMLVLIWEIGIGNKIITSIIYYI